MATKNVRPKMNDMNGENIGNFQSRSNSPTDNERVKPQSKSSSAAEDYIDFEEIK